MQDKQEDQFGSFSSSTYAYGALLSFSLATYGLMRCGGYRFALELYKRGGGGFNLYQGSKRVVGLDYHPFWHQGKLAPRIHYHRGEGEEIKKHRPHQGW